MKKESQNETPGVPAVIKQANEVAVKPNLISALKHVFSGKEGTLISRLEDIRKMAESEMSEEEKKDSQDLMASISKFAKGK